MAPNDRVVISVSPEFYRLYNFQHHGQADAKQSAESMRHRILFYLIIKEVTSTSESLKTIVRRADRVELCLDSVPHVIFHLKLSTLTNFRESLFAKHRDTGCMSNFSGFDKLLDLTARTCTCLSLTLKDKSQLKFFNTCCAYLDAEQFWAFHLACNTIQLFKAKILSRSVENFNYGVFF